MKVVWGRARQCLLSALGILAVTPLGALAEMAEIGGIAQVYVRAGPGTEFDSVETLSAGAPVDILDVEGSWTKIQTRDGKVGFVYHKYVHPHVGSGGAPQPVAVARPEATRAVAPRANAAATAPLPIPTMAADPSVEPPPAAPRDDLTVEVGRLRTEIADLKREIQDREAEMYETSSRSARGMVSPIPSSGSAPGAMTAREQSAGALAVGFLALLAGWVLGSAFTRRRSRSQRPRLRF